MCARSCAYVSGCDAVGVVILKYTVICAENAVYFPKMPLSFILSQKEKRLLNFNNYLYNEHSKSEDKVDWGCVDYSGTKCCRRVQASSDTKYGVALKESLFDLNHGSESSGINVQKIKAKIKKNTTKKTSKNPTNIIGKKVSTIIPFTSFLFPKTESLPDEHSVIIRDQTERALLFITDSNLKVLRKYKQWQTNGTFDTVS